MNVSVVVVVEFVELVVYLRDIYSREKIFNSDHCLHHLLPPVKSRLPMQLRPRCLATHYKMFCLVTMIKYRLHFY